MTESDGVKAIVEQLIQDVDELIALHRVSMQKASDLKFSAWILDIGHANDFTMGATRGAANVHDLNIGAIESLEAVKFQLNEWLRML